MDVILLHIDLWDSCQSCVILYDYVLDVLVCNTCLCRSHLTRWNLLAQCEPVPRENRENRDATIQTLQTDLEEAPVDSLPAGDD